MDKHHTDNPQLNPRTDKIHLNHTVNIVKERQAMANRIPVEGILPSTHQLTTNDICIGY